MGIIYSSDHDFEMKRNNLLPVFWNYFESIKPAESTYRIKKLKKELEEILAGVSEVVGIRNLQYYISAGSNDKMKLIFKDKIKELTLGVKREIAITEEEKVANQIRHLYYDSDSIPFKTLYNNVSTIYQFIKPVAPSLDLVAFYKHLFRQIDFESLSDSYSKENIFELVECKLTIDQALEAFRRLYVNLSNLKDDINRSINSWQLKIGELNSDEVTLVRNHLVSTAGALKILAKSNIAGADFYTRFDQIFSSLRNNDRLRDFDYQILIVNFAEVMACDLIGTFEILIDSLTRITPKVAESGVVKASKNNQIPAPVIGLFCYSLNDSGIFTRGEDESNVQFCKRACAKYNLPYTDRVRQNYSGIKTKKNKGRVLQLIVPTLDDTTSKAISEYLNKNK